ncbi:unnamed protein product [Lactuca saligna]|uniref:RRM domain-containing protein n=1 Tax=Lactuca saligna TaxID=75948 RepID=A0AA35ZNV7_LACSI|nr:unnamed protein product [Lactuca saligna]
MSIDAILSLKLYSLCQLERLLNQGCHISFSVAQEIFFIFPVVKLQQHFQTTQVPHPDLWTSFYFPEGFHVHESLEAFYLSHQDSNKPDESEFPPIPIQLLGYIDIHNRSVPFESLPKRCFIPIQGKVLKVERDCLPVDLKFSTILFPFAYSLPDVVHLCSLRLGREFEINGKAVSFYFQNFPLDWNETALWQTFKRYETVVDVYIAKKLNRNGRKFGFVRFIRVQDIPAFERRLNETCIGAQKINLNVARFDRRNQETPLINPYDARRTKESPGITPHMNSRSFAKVVKGVNSSSVCRGDVEGTKPKQRTIKMLSSEN